ncbi:MAG: hypothetical protein AAB066_00325 [Candidatus Margulisiibacteriota bacterium]
MRFMSDRQASPKWGVISLGLILFALSTGGCTQLRQLGTAQSSANQFYLLTSPSSETGTISLIHLSSDEAVSVSDNVASAGNAPNDADLAGGYLYVVNSTDSTITRYNAGTLAVDTQLSAGNGANPYEQAFLTDGQSYVSNLLTHTVSVIDWDRTPTLATTITLPSGNALLADAGQVTFAYPQAIATDNGKVYVGLTNHTGNYSYYAKGILTVINGTTGAIEKNIQLSHKNPQQIYRHPSFPNRLFITLSGAYDGTGVIDIVNTLTDTVENSFSTGGAPGKMVLNSAGKGVVTDATFGAGTKILLINVNSRAKTGDATLTTSGYASALGIDTDDRLYITSSVFGGQSTLYVSTIDGTTIGNPITVPASPIALTYTR